jgi:hypothetical protein
MGAEDLSAARGGRNMKPNTIVTTGEKEYRGQPLKDIARLLRSCYKPIPLLTSETRFK